MALPPLNLRLLHHRGEVGAAIAGPLAVALGTSSALWLAAAALLLGNVTMLLIPAVWRIQARPAEMAPAIP